MQPTKLSHNRHAYGCLICKRRVGIWWVRQACCCSHLQAPKRSPRRPTVLLLVRDVALLSSCGLNDLISCRQLVRLKLLRLLQRFDCTSMVLASLLLLIRAPRYLDRARIEQFWRAVHHRHVQHRCPATSKSRSPSLLGQIRSLIHADAGKRTAEHSGTAL